LLACGVVGALALPACNILVPASYIVAGTGQAPAVYELPDKPTVVFVDDAKSVIAGPVNLRRIIGDKTSEQLMVHDVVSVTISPRDAINAAREGTSDAPIPAGEIGRKLGADQVIYVEMAAFQPGDEFNPRPSAACWVRVLDVPTSSRVFPPPDSGEKAHLVQIAPREVMTGGGSGGAASTRRKQELLAEQLGDELARLFYEHTPRELGANLNPR
jgi:hypothetical protein